LYKGKSRLCKKLFHSFDKDLLTWALSVKVGDYISTCEGCNRKVASIGYFWNNEGLWQRGKKNRNWFLSEVVFTDSNGRKHYCPGGGCASPKESNEMIINRFKEHWSITVELDEFGDFSVPPEFAAVPSDI